MTVRLCLFFATKFLPLSGPVRGETVPNPKMPTDAPLQSVKAVIMGASGPNQETTFSHLIRQALDEVIDGGRTGRWKVEQLEKTEKTYIGTKLEILVRNQFEFPRGKTLDLKIAGHEVDVKSTVRNNWNWMIPKEARGNICLLIRADEKAACFSVGLLRMTDDNLTLGENRDRKVSVSSIGKQRIDWLVAPSLLPPNFLATLSDSDRTAIFNQRKGQARVTEFLRRVTSRVIPRLAIETVAQQKDPMKRIRKNGGAQDELLNEGIVIFVGDWIKPRALAAACGLPPIKPGEVVSFKTTVAHANELLQQLD